nr:DUF3320 domain-containing protein [Afipia sp. P52-10]
MAAEAPVREDALAQRVARAHGWLHTGARIRDQITHHLKELEGTGSHRGSIRNIPLEAWHRQFTCAISKAARFAASTEPRGDCCGRAHRLRALQPHRLGRR